MSNTDQKPKIKKAPPPPHKDAILAPTPMDLLEKAVGENLDLDKMEKLMTLQERWEERQARKEFLRALTDFQADCPVIEREAAVKFGQTAWNYAPLATIIKTIKGKLKECGLSYRFETKETDGSIAITCILAHISGHVEKNEMTAKADTSGSKNQIQAKGSTITYLMRYTLIGSLGLSTADQDVDGEGTPKVATEPLPTLEPGGPKWDDAIEAMAKKSVTIEEIKKRYSLTSKNEHLLCLQA